MKPVDINLASSPYRNDLPIWATLGVLSALALAFSGYNAWAFFTADARRAELEAEIAGHRERMHEKKVEADKLKLVLSKVDEETLASQAGFVSSILERRNFSWTQLFNALERVTPWDVKLVSIRPQFETLNRLTGKERVRVQVQGVARSFESFLGLQESLQDASMFSEITPEDYERQSDDRTDFNIAFTYSPIPPAPIEGEGDEAVTSAAGDFPAESDAPEGGNADLAAEEAEEAGESASQAGGRASAATSGDGSSPRSAAGPQASAGSSAPGARRPPETQGDQAVGGAPPTVSGGVIVDSGARSVSGQGTSPAPASKAAKAAPGTQGSGEETAVGTPPAAGAAPPRQPVEVQQIDGKPAFKPRINPDRPAESGYRGRTPDPEGKK